jgi:hypothetical protein
MENICMIICTILCTLCTIKTFLDSREPKQEAKQDFTDDEISKIKQVVNILTWGGEDENQN